PSRTPTTEPTTTSSTTSPTTTMAPTIDLIGSIAFLKTVGFDGVIDDIDSRPPADGAGCSGSGGYADIVPGASVTITNGVGATLAVVPLQGGAIVRGVRQTDSERTRREDLMDSIFELRKAKARHDSVRRAQLDLDRANARVA